MFIGVDIGTTNVKAVVFGDAGEMLASASRPNTVLTPQSGWNEQEPEAVFRNVSEVLEEVLNGQAGAAGIRGIAFSSAMHGLAAFDGAGRPLCHFMLWSDLRADAIAARLKESGTGAEIYARTGVPVHAMSPLCKLIWLRENRPELFQKTHKFLGIKDYVWFRLTGQYQCDLSVASATGLMNIHTNDWDEMALALAGVRREQLPELVGPGCRAEFTPNLKFAENSPPLIIGASDGALANLGSGATAPGQVAVTIGTSAAIRMVTPEPVLDPGMRTFCYRLDSQRCILGGASNNGANALEWLRTGVFQSALDAGQFADLASGAPPGADGLFFLPYLLGERAPLYRADATGSFQGIRAGHGQAHFVRAVMEGVLFNLKVIAGALENYQPIRTLHAGGGFSQSLLWVQMLADIFQKPVFLHENDADASVLGAVMLGREISGLAPLDEKRQGRVVEPDASRAELYEGLFRKFKTQATEFSRPNE